MLVLIDQRNDSFPLEEKYFNQIEKAISMSLKMAGYGDDYEFSFSIVDEDEIRELNRDYRENDSITDVLSFPLYEREDIPAQGMLGDIVICAKRAKEQSEEFGHSYEREIVYLTVHSVLHLLGYDHEEDDEKSEMRQIEKSIMKELGVFK
ncbi:MAG: rRNA maturation RNase YbeY [Tissierellia bacterium]|nr:rRNA maturation RNase YbeY [Tissierellia bacterium]